MNFVPVISVNYAPYKDPQFFQFTTALRQNLTDNSRYPKPTPALAEYQELIDAFQVAMQHLQAGQKGARYERDRTRALLEAATRDLSDYAMKTVRDRPDEWAEVGFPLTKDSSTPRPAAQPVTNFQLTDGDMAHTLAASVDRQPGIYGYLWRIRPKNGPSGRFCYETLVSHTPDIVISGLDSETAYCLECAAWNGETTLVWSAALSRFVQ